MINLVAVFLMLEHELVVYIINSAENQRKQCFRQLSAFFRVLIELICIFGDTLKKIKRNEQNACENKAMLSQNDEYTNASIKANFSGSNIFWTMKICSRYR